VDRRDDSFRFLGGTTQIPASTLRARARHHPRGRVAGIREKSIRQTARLIAAAKAAAGA